MIRVIFAVLLVLPTVSFAAFNATAPQGFHWYTHDDGKALPALPPKPKAQPQVVISQPNIRPSVELKYLTGQTRDTLSTALLHPSVANTTRYMRAQQFWAKKDQAFVRTWQQALLQHPELDYSLNNPTNSTAIPIRNDEHKLLVDRTIKEMSHHFGLILFYRGNSSLCQKFISILMPLVKANHFAMVSVTTDHQPIMGLPVPRDIPLSEVHRVLGIQKRYLPALFLVNLRTHQMQALSYGFIATEDLKERFLDVLNDFKQYSYQGLGESAQ